MGAIAQLQTKPTSEAAYRQLKLKAHYVVKTRQADSMGRRQRFEGLCMLWDKPDVGEVDAAAGDDASFNTKALDLRHRARREHEAMMTGRDEV